MRKMMSCYQTDDAKYIIMEFSFSGKSVAIPLTRKVKLVVEGISKECLAP